MRKTGNTTIEAMPQAQDQWVDHANESINATLIPTANSWWMGANIPGKPRACLFYLGPEGFGGYRKKCNEIATNNYEGFALM
jgi:cyclohexanone monooxygenase